MFEIELVMISKVKFVLLWGKKYIFQLIIKIDVTSNLSTPLF